MNDIWLTVNDLKQYLYCPRVVFYHTVMPVERNLTYKMRRGQSSQSRLEKLELRRKLKRYGLEKGQRCFNRCLSAPGLALSGKLDCFIISGDAEYFPLDFKDTMQRPHPNHLLQLAAYGLLLEHNYHTEVSQGFIYTIPRDNIYACPITAEWKDKVLDILQKIRIMINRQQMPGRCAQRAKCTDCEFRNFCADIF